jgi:ABC-type transporter Mla subunit MlaD
LKTGITYLSSMSDRKLGYAIICLFLAISAAIVGYGIRPLLAPPQTRVLGFEKIGNLRLDDQVRLKGIAFGKVKKIDWTRKRVFVTVQTDKPLTFHPGYSVTTMDAGIMGDRMIMMDNGPENSPALSPADTLTGDFVPGVSEALGYTWKLRDMVDSLRDQTFLLLRGDSRHKSLVFQTKGAIHTVDSLSKTVVRFAAAAKSALPPGIDSLDKFLNQTSTLSRSIKTSGPSYLAAIKRQIAKLDDLLTTVDTTSNVLLAVSASLAKEDNILWKDDIKKLTADLVTVQETINGVQKELLKFKTYLRLW